MIADALRSVLLDCKAHSGGSGGDTSGTGEGRKVKYGFRTHGNGTVTRWPRDVYIHSDSVGVPRVSARRCRLCVRRGFKVVRRGWGGHNFRSPLQPGEGLA